MIDRGLFDAYATALDANAELARLAMLDLAAECEGLAEAETRRLLAQAYPALVAEYGRYAAATAVELYAELRAAADVGEAFEPQQYEPRDGGLLRYDVNKAVRESAGIASTLGNLANTGVQRVMERADRTIWENAKRDPAKPKWALVPNLGACGWCVMIGSRGFDYSSEKTVSSTRHPSCKCTPVVDFDVENPKLEGYDPDGMYVRYRQCEDTIRDSAEAEWKSMSAKEQAKFKRKGKSAHSVFMRDRTIAEMNLRDRDWLSTGKKPGIAYDKPRSALADHERSGIDKLCSNGFALRVLSEDANAPSNLDVMLGNRSYEMKNVTNAESSVSNQIKRARIKWYKQGLDEPARIVFTMEGCESSLDEVCNGIRKRMRAGESIMLVVSNRTVLRI